MKSHFQMISNKQLVYTIYDQILWIEYTLHYDHQTETYTNTIEEISRKTDPIHEKEFVLSYLNILFINYYTKYNHL